MSQTYVGIIVMVLSQLLPSFGIVVGSDQLTTTISTIITIGGALYAFWGRYRLGGITIFGRRV